MLSRPSGLSKGVRTATGVLAVGYPLVLILIALLLRFEGEGWWATAIGLYLPRMGFALPLPVLVLLLLALRLRKLLWTQLIAVIVVVFPLMGFVVSFPRSPRAGEPTVRVLSLNVDSGYFGIAKIDEQIQKFSPDIVVLQEVELEARMLADVLNERYARVVSTGQFILASRFPITEITNPERSVHEGKLHSPHFMRYLIDSPLGSLVVYNVHTNSPRGVFYKLRGQSGLTREILSGRIFTGWAAADIADNYSLRAFQIQAAADAASRETDALLIVGDTNLPGLSRTFAQYLSRYQDGFAKAGNGFGYTFQSFRRWMRLDRVLASDQLAFWHFEVGCPDVSDHLCVVADVQRDR